MIIIVEATTEIIRSDNYPEKKNLSIEYNKLLLFFFFFYGKLSEILIRTSVAAIIFLLLNTFVHTQAHGHTEDMMMMIMMMIFQFFSLLFLG